MGSTDRDVLIHRATPTYVCGTVDRIFIVRWVGAITRDGMGGVFECMIEARRRLGVPLVAVSIVPAELDGPPHTSTPVTESRFEIVDHLTEALYVVFEGDSVQRKIVRGLISLRALTMKIEILPCASVGEALERASRHVNRDAFELRELAHGAGLVV